MEDAESERDYENDDQLEDEQQTVRSRLSIIFDQP